MYDSLECSDLSLKTVCLGNGDHGFGMSNKGTTSDHAAQMTLAIGSGKETGPENEISL